MNKKRALLISIISILIIGIFAGIYIYLNKEDKKTTLTVLDKQWIDDNKNNIIDLSIVNNVPIFNYEGQGLFFDFIDSIENTTGLHFNKLSYNKDDKPTSDYSFSITDKVEENDILIYEDNYVLVTKTNKKYNNINKINQMVVGVLNDEADDVNYYLGINKNLSFKTYTTIANLIASMSDTNGVDAIVLPKTMYLKEIVESDKLYISYDLTDMKKYFVLRLGSNKKLNKIIKKYYNKWYKDEYDESFYKNFSDDYFAFKQIYEQEKVNFRSKKYTYGFVEYAPFDSLKNSKLIGINDEIIKDFSKVSDIQIGYEKYKNYEELLKAFNENKIDFYLNMSSIDDYALDVYNTVEVFNPEIAVLSKIDNDVVINSELSLSNYDIVTIKNSKIEKYLETNKIKAKTYDNVTSLLNNKKSDELIVIDKEVYDTFMYSSLKNYKIDYIFNINDGYLYTCRNISDNKVFNEYLDFYSSYINSKKYQEKITYKMFEEKLSDNKTLMVILIVLIILVIISTIVLILKLKPKKINTNITKEDKLRYIDMLTSLKNRNYLNDYIEKWDNSEIYPQAIVIIDLNNIAYINDNYGHEEGDNVIKEAAAILVKTQIENTEIIRTNGNEFLIYLVEYDEKQVVSYIRKLNKEMKELNHGFGAAIGYSMINDELKTIDDAINEATLDMKTNKEETQN